MGEKAKRNIREAEEILVRTVQRPGRKLRMHRQALASELDSLSHHPSGLRCCKERTNSQKFPSGLDACSMHTCASECMHRKEENKRYFIVKSAILKTLTGF